MQENQTAKIVFTVGWLIIIIGVAGGFILGELVPIVRSVGTYITREKTSYNWGLALGVAIGSAISGVLFIAISEIIKLLQNLVNRVDKLPMTPNEQANGTGNSIFSI